MPVTEFVPNRTTKLLRFYVARHARMLHVPPTACVLEPDIRARSIQPCLSKVDVEIRLFAAFRPIRGYFK